MRVVVTGAGGMVGRNLLEHPALRQFEVLAPPRAELDLRDYGAVERYLRRLNPDAVVHAAGRVGGIQANIREPVAFLLENLDMGRNIVWAARVAGISRLINLGSSCMYPRNADNPLREEMVLQGELEPTNEGYALAKITTARLCQYIRRESPEFQYKTLIPCNIYGRYDKFEPAHSHLVAAVIHKIHAAKNAGRAEVEIWGDGTARREFMYAADLADCIVAALSQTESSPDMMNVGVGTDHSVNDYYAMVAKVVGYSGRFRHDLSKPVGMARKLVSTEKADAWGWRARTGLEEGIRRTYEYYLERYADAR